MNITDPIYSDEEAAREHFERVNWPDDPICPHCGVIDLEAGALFGPVCVPKTQTRTYW
jgi:hypothetical protein